MRKALIDVALVVGHRRSAQGASGHGVTEWTFWKTHVQTLAGMLGERGWRVAVVEREDTPQGYRELPGRVLALDPRCVVSTHLNKVGSETVSGTETLTAAGDAEDLRLARLVNAGMVRALGLRDRGVKPIPKNHRGASLLFGLWTVPTCLIEPCFVSSADDVATLQANIIPMLEAIARAIGEYLNGATLEAS